MSVGTKIEAPAIQAGEWFNTIHPLSLTELRGKVVVLHAFQMLCPGCVSHGLPQTKAIHDNFSREEVAVIGLHSVFEHHHAMTPQALKAFIHEYCLSFPIAVDQPDDKGSAIPRTMQRYNMQGTPTLVLIDKQGFVRLNHFGRLSDLFVGAFLGQLTAENMTSIPEVCDDTGCSIG